MIDVLLRDQIAMAAMQAFIQRIPADLNSEAAQITARQLCDDAYRMADVMLEAKVKAPASDWLREDPAIYLELPRRVANAVRAQHILTMEDLLDTRAYFWLNRVPNMGAMSAKQLFTALENRGLKLKS
jgi:DNA-directed RNA polymerase alpha subunit